MIWRCYCSKRKICCRVWLGGHIGFRRVELYDPRIIAAVSTTGVTILGRRVSGDGIAAVRGGDERIAPFDAGTADTLLPFDLAGCTELHGPDIDGAMIA